METVMGMTRIGPLKRKPKQPDDNGTREEWIHSIFNTQRILSQRITGCSTVDDSINKKYGSAYISAKQMRENQNAVIADKEAAAKELSRSCSLFLGGSS